jgi:hypothetical protein
VSSKALEELLVMRLGSSQSLIRLRSQPVQAQLQLHFTPSVGNTTATRRQDGQTLEGEDGEARGKETASALRTVSVLVL